MAQYLFACGCGFVGRYLSRCLLAAGDEVVVLGNLSNSALTKLVPGCELLEGDVRKPDDVEAANSSSDVVFHLAAVASVGPSNRRWSKSHHTSQSGSAIVFEVAARSKVGHVVYASSAAVCGGNA
ncbi:NAD-dependent epimerase/dehydratase family protein [Silicimonas algicola]|uniref:UDP-glucose 4-epimerase n=2 Tax=Silicimonas algicola TaxID=1826607 RepID=A0A316GT34_9RHOB|nr:NAD-dependent epimerase/dehydratase family protein [Silicimonas algicola]PWK58207.1 NAD-dependent epimerase/dehydratase family protein [Silicimonas algicola]